MKAARVVPRSHGSLVVTLSASAIMVLIHVFSVFIAYAFLDCLPVLARQGFILVNGAVVMGMAGQSGDDWAKCERF